MFELLSILYQIIDKNRAEKFKNNTFILNIGDYIQFDHNGKTYTLNIKEEK